MMKKAPFILCFVGAIIALVIWLLNRAADAANDDLGGLHAGHAAEQDAAEATNKDTSKPVAAAPERLATNLRRAEHDAAVPKRVELAPEVEAMVTESLPLLSEAITWLQSEYAGESTADLIRRYHQLHSNQREPAGE